MHLGYKVEKKTSAHELSTKSSKQTFLLLFHLIFFLEVPSGFQIDFKFYCKFFF